mgnify:CR=1 FL=1
MTTAFSIQSKYAPNIQCLHSRRPSTGHNRLSLATSRQIFALSRLLYDTPVLASIKNPSLWASRLAGNCPKHCFSDEQSLQPYHIAPGHSPDKTSLFFPHQNVFHSELQNNSCLHAAYTPRFAKNHSSNSDKKTPCTNVSWEVENYLISKSSHSGAKMAPTDAVPCSCLNLFSSFCFQKNTRGWPRREQPNTETQRHRENVLEIKNQKTAATPWPCV